MSINLNKYVSITSGVAGAAGVQSRQLVGRYITSSSALLPGEIAQFGSLADVGARFSTASPEYAAATQYFGYISKIATTPQMLSMARWVKADTPPLISGIVGVSGAPTLAAIQAANAVTFAVTDIAGTVTNVVLTGISLAATVDYPTVAAALQTAFRANANPQLANATVLYTAATGQFTLQGGVSGSGSIAVVPLVNPLTDLGKQLGWYLSDGAIDTSGIAAQTPVVAVTASTNLSNNFGSFGFIDSTTTPPTPLADADNVAVAAWNHAQNNTYMFCIPTTVLAATALSAQLIGYSGTAFTVAAGDFAEFCPMEILAATDYTRDNATTDYMYNQFPNRVSTVTDTPTSTALDNIRTNYNGQTMQAGQQIAFYQRGTLMGDATKAAVDMNTYANEMWLKDNITTAMINAFISLPRIPASATGQGIVLANIQYSLDQALSNGTISVGKVLTPLQKAAIYTITLDANAWQQVQTIGYWINVVIASYQTPDGRTEFKASYVLVYSKDDEIRQVTGSDILI